MAIKRTTVTEESAPATDPRVVTSTKTVTNPSIHTPVVEGTSVAVDTPTSSTVEQTRVVQEPLVKTEHPQKIYEKKKSILRTYEIIWVVVGIIEILLLFRISLRALGADPTSGFASLIYTISYPLAAPFFGILRTNYGTGNSVFEWSTIIAAAVYVVVAFILVQLLGLIRPITTEEVEHV
jgi:hypothetical protein